MQGEKSTPFGKKISIFGTFSVLHKNLAECEKFSCKMHKFQKRRASLKCCRWRAVQQSEVFRIARYFAILSIPFARYLMMQGIRCPQIPRFAKYIRHLLLQVIDTLRTEASLIFNYYFIPSIPIVRLREHSVTIGFCFLVCCVRHNTFRFGILMTFIYAVVIHIIISYCFGCGIPRVPRYPCFVLVVAVVVVRYKEYSDNRHNSRTNQHIAEREQRRFAEQVNQPEQKRNPCRIEREADCKSRNNYYNPPRELHR